MGFEQWRYIEETDTFECVDAHQALIVTEATKRFPDIVLAYRTRNPRDIPCNISGRGGKCTRPAGHPGKHLNCKHSIEYDVKGWF